MDIKNTEKVPEKVKDPKDFVKEFNDLCEKYQMQIITQPSFKARDDGTWSVVLTSSVGLLPKKE